MRQIPVVNRQALGSALTVPGSRRLDGLRPGERRLVLGQMGPSIGGAELAYRGAVSNLEGVKKAYSKLEALLGEEETRKILKDAQDAVENAQAEFMRQLPRK